MIKEEQKDLMKLLTRPYTIEILYFMRVEAKRFKDLKQICKNERTITNKIKLLEKFNLVKTIPIKEGRRYFNTYTTSKRGLEVLHKLENI